MLQDALFARAAWLAEGDNETVAKNFLTASFQGWIYCRDSSRVMSKGWMTFS